MRIRNFTTKRLVPVVAAIAVVAGLATPVDAATLTTISKTTSNAVPSATGVTDTFAFGNVTTSSALGCVSVTYSTGADGVGAIGAPFSIAGAASATSSFWGGGTVNVTGNTVQLRAAAPVATPAASGTVSFGGLVNGNTPNTTYYTLVRTFSDTACTTEVDRGVVGFVFTASTQVSVVVDPTMSFIVGGGSAACSQQITTGGHTYTNAASATDVNLGRINSSTVGQSSNTLAVTTNAAGGAVVTLRGDQSGVDRSNANMRSGGNIIEDRAAAPVVGTESFSYTNSSTSYTNSAWKRVTNAPVAVAGSTAGSFSGECVGFSASAGTNTGGGVTPAGAYTARIYYTAVPTF